MKLYKCRTNNRKDKEIVDAANEVLNCYLNNHGHESMKKSIHFHDLVKNYIFQTNTVDKLSFIRIFKENSELKYNEYVLFANRLRYVVNNNNTPDYACEHNMNFIEWFLVELNLIDENGKNDELQRRRNKFFKEPVFNYSRNTERKFKNIQAIIFYRNAYRAEIYSRQVFSLNTANDGIKAKVEYVSNNERKVVDAVGMYDMYLPLILTRMAVEQYIKELYVTYIGQYDREKISVLLKSLLSKGKVSKEFFNELNRTIQRGNNNTHRGEPGLSYGIIHGLRIVEECSKYFQRNCK